MHYTKDPIYNPELVKHKGCEGCLRKCQYNGKVATPEVAERSATITFDCNSMWQLAKRIVVEIVQRIERRKNEKTQEAGRH